MTDEYIMNPYKLPLARYYQLLRIASKLKRESTDEEQERLAWLGWQIAGHEFQMKNKKPPTLKDWREMVGLAALDKFRNKVTKEATDEEKREILMRTLEVVNGDPLRTKSLAASRERAEKEAREKVQATIV